MNLVSHGGNLSQEELEAAGRFDLFADFTTDEARRLLRGASCRMFPRNSLLFTQGDLADRFFLVLEGRVKLVKSTESGSEGIVEVFTRGHSFGEAAMFMSRRFPVGAEVLSDARLIQVPAEIFMAELARAPELALKLLATLARRYRHLVRQIGELKLKSPGQRLGCYLLSLIAVPEGEVVVQLPMDKGVVAGRVGVTPESLSRALARLRECGVRTRGREVVVEDVRALRAFCQVDESEPLPTLRRVCE